jgi:hypothetical protein
MNDSYSASVEALYHAVRHAEKISFTKKFDISIRAYSNRV